MVQRLESETEQKWCDWVENEFNLIALKLTPMGRNGYPDRIVFLPAGRVFLIEWKREGKKVVKADPLQVYIHEELGKLEHGVLLTNSIEEAKEEFRRALSDAIIERQNTLGAG